MAYDPDDKRALFQQGPRTSITFYLYEQMHFLSTSFRQRGQTIQHTGKRRKLRFAPHASDLSQKNSRLKAIENRNPILIDA